MDGRAGFDLLCLRVVLAAAQGTSEELPRLRRYWLELKRGR